MNKYIQYNKEKRVIKQAFINKEISIEEYVSDMKTLKNNMPNIEKEMIKEYGNLLNNYYNLLINTIQHEPPCINLDFLKEGVIFIQKKSHCIKMSDNNNYELKDNECWKKVCSMDFQTGKFKTDYQLYKMIKLDLNLQKLVKKDLYKHFHKIIDNILTKINGTNISNFDVYENDVSDLETFIYYSYEYDKVSEKIEKLKSLQ